MVVFILGSRKFCGMCIFTVIIFVFAVVTMCLTQNVPVTTASPDEGVLLVRFIVDLG